VLNEDQKDLLDKCLKLTLDLKFYNDKQFDFGVFALVFWSHANLGKYDSEFFLKFKD